MSGKEELRGEDRCIKVTKEFTKDMRLLVEKIAQLKIQPMDALATFEDLIKKHYGEPPLGFFEKAILYRLFQTYLQIWTLSRLMILHVR